LAAPEERGFDVRPRLPGRIKKRGEKGDKSPLAIRPRRRKGKNQKSALGQMLLLYDVGGEKKRGKGEEGGGKSRAESGKGKLSYTL